MVFKKRKTKQGGTLVEAALVWPIVILSVLAVLTMIMSLFSESVILTSSHMSLREMAGRWTQTVGLSEENLILYESISSNDVAEELKARAEFWMSKNKIPMTTERVEGEFSFFCLYPDVSLRVRKNFGGFGLLQGVSKRQMVCRYQCTNEAQFIRNWDYAVETIGKVGNHEKK